MTPEQLQAVNREVNRRVSDEIVKRREQFADRLIVLIFFLGVLWGSLAYGADPELIRARSCLVFPWDETNGFQSYAQITNTSDQNIVSHWVYWSSSCDKLADVTVCLTPQGGHVMDSSAVQNSIWVDGQSETRGDPVDVGVAATARGLDPSGTLYVAAYGALPGDFLDCLSSGQLVSEAILGRWATANVDVGVAAGGNAQGFGLSDDASRCELPDSTLSGLTVETFAPVSLTSSAITIFAAEESAGEDASFQGELGPACRRRGAFPRPCLVQSPTSFVNDEEIRTSLGDLLFGCSTRIDLTQGVTAQFSTGGAFTLDQPVIVPTDLQLPVVGVGGTTWVGAFSFESVASFGVGHSAWIHEGPAGPTPQSCPPERQIIDPSTGEIIGCLPAPTPSPTPNPTPTPTPVTCPLGSTPIFDPTTGALIGCIAPSPSPTPVPSPEVTPTP
jgi:hypothetical protein